MRPRRLDLAGDVAAPGGLDHVAGAIAAVTCVVCVELSPPVTLPPPEDQTDSDSDGFFDNPGIYEIVDSAPGGANVTDDYSLLSLSHGTGLLTDSAWNAIPQLDSDIQSWLTSFNYPFDAAANRTSTIGIIIPSGLFREFDITAPAGDQPTGDNSGTFFPVWISRVERIGTGTNQLRFYFATYNVTDEAADGTPSTTPIEFASLDLSRTFSEGEVVEITRSTTCSYRPAPARSSNSTSAAGTWSCRRCGITLRAKWPTSSTPSSRSWTPRPTRSSRRRPPGCPPSVSAASRSTSPPWARAGLSRAPRAAGRRRSRRRSTTAT